MTRSLIRRSLAGLFATLAILSLGPSVAALAQGYDDPDRYGAPGPAGPYDDEGSEPPRGGFEGPPDEGPYDGPRDRPPTYDRQPPPADFATVDAPPDISSFYEPLDRYGRWERHSVYGYVWVPDGIDEDWRPYTRGSWAFTDEYGWYWQSEEPWGWATYHYGRWAYDPELHWFWVPGRVWGPAWVAWRYSDDYVGWAPLPPRAGGRGDDMGMLFENPRYSHFWIFVRPRFFLTPAVGRFVQAPYLAETIIPRTRPAGTFSYSGRRVVNVGIDPREIERMSHRPVRPSRIVVTDRLRDFMLERPARGSVEIYKPRVWSRPAVGSPPQMRTPRRDWGGAERRPEERAHERRAPAAAAPPPVPAPHAAPPTGNPPTSPSVATPGSPTPPPSPPKQFEHRRPARGTPPQPSLAAPTPSTPAPAPAARGTAPPQPSLATPAPSTPAPAPAAGATPPPSGAAPPKGAPASTTPSTPAAPAAPPAPPQAPRIINRTPPPPAPSPAAQAQPKATAPAPAQPAAGAPAKDKDGHKHRKPGDPEPPQTK